MTMNGLRVVKTSGINILKGAAVALASLAGLMVGGMLTRALNLPPVGLPAFMNMALVMPLMLLSELLLAVVLGECFQRLYQAYWQRLLALWLCHYLLYSALNTLDGMLFTTVSNLGTGLVGNLFPALFAAAVIAWLWRPGAGPSPERGSLRDYITARRPADWIWRFALAWLCFPPLYYLVGRVVAIYTLSYYQNHASDLGLTLNLTLGSLMAMQVLRGALFLLAVLPIIMSWKGSRTGLWLQVGLVIFAQIVIQELLQGYWLPFWAVRVPHGLELLVDSFVQAFVYASLLFRPVPSTESAPAGRQLQAAV
jgi:hypothetical protein